MRFLTIDETTTWDDRVIANPDGGNVFQSATLADVKRRGGWTPRYITADSVAILALEKSIPLIGKIWYLPKGPGVTNVRELDALLAELRAFAAEHGVFLIKIEPEIPQAGETVVDLLKMGLTKSHPIQPNFSTVLIDLAPDIETIMSNLNQKGRHAIRRAERDGVDVQAVDATDARCREMYELFSATAEGAFRIRKYDYYRAFWQGFAVRGQGQMFFAYVDGKLVAAAYALLYGAKSTYKDGASSRERTVYGASHLLQWRVIEWAKAHGSQVHDLCGVPPAAEISNPDHPHYGLGRFKTSFNKSVTEYVGVYDIPISPRGHKLWKSIGERMVLSWHSQVYHENFY